MERSEFTEKVCAVCWVPKAKSGLMKISTACENLIKKHVHPYFDVSTLNHFPSVCTYCKRKLHSLDNGDSVPSAWLEMIKKVEIMLDLFSLFIKFICCLCSFHI